MSDNQNRGDLWVNVKNGSLAILFLALAVGLFKLLDASADYVMTAEREHAGILNEYRMMATELGGKASELMDHQINVIDAVEASVRQSEGLIGESRRHVEWLNGVSYSIFPEQAQEDMAGLINRSVHSLTEAVAYLQEHPEDVDAAIQRFLESVGESQPFQQLGEAIAETAVMAGEAMN